MHLIHSLTHNILTLGRKEERKYFSDYIFFFVIVSISFLSPIYLQEETRQRRQRERIYSQHTFTLSLIDK